MLAAQSAWAILRKEHAQMRGLLASIDEAAKGGACRQGGPALASLKERVEALRTFDRSHHRPKGVALIGALRGRSPEADRLIAMLEEDRGHDDALLDMAIDLIDAAAAGQPHACAECEDLLAQHRQRALEHMDQEDTLLRRQSELLLSPEEWSKVASSISRAMYPRREPERTEGAEGAESDAAP